MTSFAFILGVAPLVLATGAGASARKSIGITVFTGMIASTCLAVLFVPSFFVVVQRFEEWLRRAQAAGRMLNEVTLSKNRGLMAVSRLAATRASAFAVTIMAAACWLRPARQRAGKRALAESARPAVRAERPASARQASARTGRGRRKIPSDLILRLDRLEAQVRQLTGTIEQLQFRNQQLETQLRADAGRPAHDPEPAADAASAGRRSAGPAQRCLRSGG